MAQDRNGKPIRVDNLVRIPVRPVRPLQVEPYEWSKGESTPTLFVYPESSDVEYLTGRVVLVEDDEDGGMVQVKVDGIESAVVMDTRLVEVTA